MHARQARCSLGCTDCHGGDAGEGGGQPGSKQYDERSGRRTCCPGHRDLWKHVGATRSAAYTALLEETCDFVRFVNPGDLRVGAPDLRRRATTGTRTRSCATSRKSMMTHGGML